MEISLHSLCLCCFFYHSKWKFEIFSFSAEVKKDTVHEMRFSHGAQRHWTTLSETCNRVAVALRLLFCSSAAGARPIEMQR